MRRRNLPSEGDGKRASTPLTPTARYKAAGTVTPAHWFLGFADPYSRWYEACNDGGWHFIHSRKYSRICASSLGRAVQ
jgi:hypothetical protein